MVIVTSLSVVHSAVGSLPWCTVGHTALETYQQPELYCGHVKPVIVRKKIKEGESLEPLCTWCNYISFDVTQMQITNVPLLMKAFADDWNDGQIFFPQFVRFLSYCTALVLRHWNPPPCKTGCRPGKKFMHTISTSSWSGCLLCSMCVSNPQRSLESHHQCFL